MVITVDIHETRHTCPANHEPHWFMRQNTVVSVVDGGPCRTPVTIQVGTRSAYVSCGRHEPQQRQCVACKTLLIVRNLTHADLGHHASCGRIEVTA